MMRSMSGPPELTTWIAFLRAINLGARRRFPKDAIVEATRAAGGTVVATYIASGNVRLDHPAGERGQVEEALEEAYAADRGFDVPTICLSPAELREVVAYADGLAHSGRHYVSLLKEVPAAEQVAAIEGASTEGERAIVRGRAVHLLLGENYHTARLTNAAVERHVGVSTNRNVTVLRTLAQRWA